MSNEDRDASGHAWNQLQLILDIFPRTDTMVGALLAIDTAMVAFFFSRWPPVSSATPAMVIVTLVYALFAGLALMEIYRCAFPNVDGNDKSVIFFKAIAARKTAMDYATDFSTHDERALSEQILEQVWRNSRILTSKFERLRAAMLWLLASVPAWVVFFIVSTN